MTSFIKVKSDNIIEFVKISPVIDDNTEEITSDDIIYSVGLAFEFRENAVLKFCDRDGANIENDHLAQIVKQYGECSSFLLVVFTGDEQSISKSFEKKSAFQIHSAGLEAHLRSGDYSHILREYSDSGTHTDSSRRLLVREAVSFMRHHFGNYPTKTQKIATAEAIIALFPNYNVEASAYGGIELFYNPIDNTGFLLILSCNTEKIANIYCRTGKTTQLSLIQRSNK